MIIVSHYSTARSSKRSRTQVLITGRQAEELHHLRRDRTGPLLKLGVVQQQSAATASPGTDLSRPGPTWLKLVRTLGDRGAGGADESSDRPVIAVFDPAAGYPTRGASNRVTGGVDAGMTAGRPMPTQDDVLGYFNTLSNWGRWGDEDELGTLNHITDDVRLAAARAVRHGRSVSCAWEVAVPEDMERSTTTCPCAADMPGAENMPVPGFHADRRWGFSSERLGITFHGNTLTHVDSPCHIFWDGAMYNGRSHSLVDAATGSAWAAVTAAANGIITRGVLLDIARARDVPWLEPGQGVFPDDLEEAERRQGVRVRSGDAVLLRTGYGRVRHEAGEASGFTQAGWHASCLPWLHERDVALIGADTPQDVQPSGYEDVLMPVHAVSLVAMGLWLLDNCDLEVCAATAAELGQWDFHLAVAPVRFAGTSGSPVNPIATF
jgi:kynurenine formamidase